MTAAPAKQAPTWARLEPRTVGDIAGHLIVPAYQRGYRWGQAEVERLLEDIKSHVDETYYLQPVVVKRDGDAYELIDGQQRLTTMFLILAHMQSIGLRPEGAGYSITYATRSVQDLADHLEGFRVRPNQSTEDIDTFHIHEARKCVREWFTAQAAEGWDVAAKFNQALSRNVKVIWYEVPSQVDGAALFRRLNSGRIGLTDAELVKALLLSKADAPTDPGGSTRPDAPRALEIAAQWDHIERDLRDPELWAFITGGAPSRASHIGLLLDDLARKPDEPFNPEPPLFTTFERLRPRLDSTREDLLGFWEQVTDLHALIMGWYADKDLFHKVGFLTANDTKFAALVEASKQIRKSQFLVELNGRIRRQLDLTESQLRDLDYENPRKSSRALLLMNVETMRTREDPGQRFSFRAYAAGSWSLEHIHAQNAQDLTRAKDWEDWLRDHRKALENLERQDAAVRDVLARIDLALANDDATAQPDPLPINRTLFKELQGRILPLLSEGGSSNDSDVQSIANLALLEFGTNSALGNSVFAVKRDRLLADDRDGKFIPVCTRNAFLKYYTPSDDQQVTFWSRSDRKYYLEELVRTLQPYLQPAGEQP